jgi:hypothetical protein
MVGELGECAIAAKSCTDDDDWRREKQHRQKAWTSELE